MSDFEAIASAVFQGCGANVGPLIGTELEIGEVTTESTPTPPEGELAVLPIECEADDTRLGVITLSAPMSEILTLARRMLGDEEPDKEAEPGSDDLDAIGEVLNLMSGAVDQVVRDQVNGGIRSRPLPWWRTADPGENQFEEGEFLLARGSVGVPGASVVRLFLRLAPRLLAEGSEAGSRTCNGRVLLLGLDPELQQSLQPLLEGALLEVRAMQPDGGGLQEAFETTDAVVLSGDQPGGLDLCRQLRLGNRSWSLPTILCLGEPTRPRVVEAIEAGASHVLRVPADETTLLRVLQVARLASP